MTIPPPEPFGPNYPRELGATVQKYRSKARSSIFDLSKSERAAWAESIEKAIKTKQRAALQREVSLPLIRCASRTAHSDGRKISAAIRDQHRAALLAYPGAVRRKRTPKEWQHLYAVAMRDKRDDV